MGRTWNVLLFVLGVLYTASSQDYCTYSIEELERAINESESGLVNNFVINCRAANGTRASSISISAFLSGTPGSGVRYDFDCRAGQFLRSVTSNNLSNVERDACTECNFTDSNPCVEECADECTSCGTEDATVCYSCRYLRNNDTTGSGLNCLSNTSCALMGFEATHEGCECPATGHYLQPNESSAYLLPNELEAFSCVSQCQDGFGPADPAVSLCGLGEAEGESRDEAPKCYACSINGCLRCNNQNNVCETCIPEYRYYRGLDNKVCCLDVHEFEEKFEEYMTELERQTEELEEEQEHEEEENEERELLLRILLPIFCTLVVVFFVAMSVFAHWYFPYVRGEDRTRSKPEPKEEHTTNEIWRPRPTVRLR